jgi:hypothetical protein
VKPLYDTVKMIAREKGKLASKGGHCSNVMAKFAEDEVSLRKYIAWLESQPVEMLQKTYYILMTGWGERREGLADVSSLFRDAIKTVTARGLVREKPAEDPPPKKPKKRKKKCCGDQKIVKLKSGGKRCKNCGKKWKPKK